MLNGLELGRDEENSMIIVDDREPKMLEHLKFEKLYAQTLHMDAGDFLLGNANPPILIERKTWGDLLGSWFSGRVQEQMQKMYATKINDIPVRPVILVEGSLAAYLAYRKTKMPSVAGMVASIFYDWKVPMIPSQSLSMSAKILKSLDRSTMPTMPTDVVNKPVHIMTAEISRTDCKLNMLACIDHVGGATAKRVLLRYRSITNIAAATEGELMKEFGTKTGKSIYSAFHGEYAE